MSACCGHAQPRMGPGRSRDIAAGPGTRRPARRGRRRDSGGRSGTRSDRARPLSSGATPVTTRPGSPSSRACSASASSPSVNPALAIAAMASFGARRWGPAIVGADDLVGEVGLGRRRRGRRRPASRRSGSSPLSLPTRSMTPETSCSTFCEQHRTPSSPAPSGSRPSCGRRRGACARTAPACPAGRRAVSSGPFFSSSSRSFSSSCRLPSISFCIVAFSRSSCSRAATPAAERASTRCTSM